MKGKGKLKANCLSKRYRILDMKFKLTFIIFDCILETTGKNNYSKNIERIYNCIILLYFNCQGKLF